MPANPTIYQNPERKVKKKKKKITSLFHTIETLLVASETPSQSARTKQKNILSYSSQTKP